MKDCINTLKNTKEYLEELIDLQGSTVKSDSIIRGLTGVIDTLEDKQKKAKALQFVEKFGEKRESLSDQEFVDWLSK
jgi:hypothetical protein